VNKGILGNAKPATVSSALPVRELKITKTGDWSLQNPAQPFFLVAPQAFQLSNAAGNSVYKRYTGKWISGFSTYSESTWSTTGGNRILSLIFEDLEGVTGTFAPNTMGAITTLSCPALAYTGSFQPFSLDVLTVFSFPALQYVVGAFGPTTMPLLTAFSFPALTHINGNFSPSTFNAVTTCYFPALSWINGSFSPATMGALTTLSFPALSFVSGNLGASGMAALTTASFPALRYVGGAASVGFTTPALANFTLPTDGTLKYIAPPTFSISGAALTLTSVDNILQALASLDGTNGTVSFGTGKTVTLSGGTSSAPSNAGSVNVTLATSPTLPNLSCSGTTCTVNLTAHGYATGDVLRVSGVTGATNANRYAVITVVNANQFTYTITSQTATGAGTATVVKAGASAKALVTRGVTLTTN
jgi:hypothetical protein